MNVSEFVLPERLQAGDKIAITSPASGAAFMFPWIYELGLKRLREVFQLEPVEFPTARQNMNDLFENPRLRAEDINRAFADPDIKAIIATIGGNDQIRILKYLDADLIRANPKIFIGLSDNTNLHLYLFQQGIISYYGGNLMMQFAMQGAMHSYTIDYFKKALFAPRIGEIEAATFFVDYDYDWSDRDLISLERPSQANSGWVWHNPSQIPLRGRLWGGCLEILDQHLAIRTYLPTLEAFEDIVMYIETSEEMPDSGFVERVFTVMGELGILGRMRALLVGRPKASRLGMTPPEGSEAYRDNQRNAIVEICALYAPALPIIFNLDFGHTDPQFLVPNGGLVAIDSRLGTIRFE